MPPPVITTDDLDGDGIPNTWETTFHHDPIVASDAGADFYNDGLTAREDASSKSKRNGVRETSDKSFKIFKRERVVTPLPF